MHDLGPLILKCFGTQACSAYVIGSHAVGQGSVSGDLDVVMVVDDPRSERCTISTDRLRKIVFFVHDIKLDIVLRKRSEILKNGCEYTRLSGVNIFGENIKYRIPLPAGNDYEQKLKKNCKKVILSSKAVELSSLEQEHWEVSSRTFRNIVSNICRLIVFQKLRIYTSQRTEAVEIFRSSIDPDFDLYKDFFGIVEGMSMKADVNFSYDNRLIELIEMVDLDE